MYFGAKRPGVPQGLPIRVDAGQSVTGVDLSLKKGGVVTGIVIGIDGEPASNVRVQLMRRLMTDGEYRFSGVGASGQPVTDDRGMFRFFGIASGSYVISVQPQTQGNQSEIRQLSDQEMRTAVAASTGKVPAGIGRVLAPALPGPLPETPPAGRPVSFAPVFYPGTTIEEQAGVFTVVAGQEVNISLAMQLVTAARIEGTVVTAEGQLMQLNGGNVMLQRSSGSGVNQTPVRMTEPGKFLAVGVPPGRYQLIARWSQPVQRPPDGGPPVPPTANSQWYAQQDVEIAGADVTGITLTLTPPVSVTGRVAFEGTPPPEAQIQVRLEPAGRAMASFARTLKPGESEFTITGVTPGRYRLVASMVTMTPPASAAMAPSGPLPPVWGVKSAVIEGREAYETPFEILAGRNPSPGMVTLTSRLPQLSANITDQSGKPVPGMTFVLFSANRQHWNGTTSRRIRSVTRPTDEGIYQFNGVLPGEYLLVVLTDLDTQDLYDPTFLEQLVPAAIRDHAG